MSLVPWTPREKRDVPMRSLFGDFFGESFPWSEHLPEAFRTRALPPVNTSEDEKNFRVSVELPGLEEKDIDVQVMGNQLTISGERKFEEEQKEQEFHRIESAYGSFSRTIALPNALKVDQADATYQKGILTVTFPKVEPTPTSKIKVKSG